MRGIAGLPQMVPNIANLAWMLPVSILAFMAVAAIASLVSGFATPEVIGADGLGGVTMAP
jgi:hypothetical protein